ncbi:MAG: hypothetical protein GKR98_12305 [Boseongicola sp.]|nr:MAG: hypothetical protein GKR98_12305 [Boseongicola sp.]
MRPQYHFRRVGDDIHIWNVRKLLELAEDLPVIQLPLADIQEIDEPYWFDIGDSAPTCRAIMEHARQAASSDLNYPILLCADGRIMDGMHRVIKALSMDHATILARKLNRTPPPNFKNVPAEDLSY